MSDYLLWLLFSLRGRIGRAPFAIIYFAHVVVATVFNSSVLPRYLVVNPQAAPPERVAFNAPAGVLALLCLFFLVSFWISLASQVKRLHDFGWSGWWIMAPGGAALVGGMFSVFFMLTSKAAGMTVIGLTVLVFVLGILALLAMMFFRRGDEGENGHPRGPGDSMPRRPDPARAAVSPRIDSAGYRPEHRAPREFGRRGARA